MEEYITLNDETEFEDVGHFLYYMEGIHLNPEDALLMTGLRFFTSNGHNLELVKSTYPNTVQPLSGFFAMIQYIRGELPVTELYKLAVIFHRLNDARFQCHGRYPYPLFELENIIGYQGDADAKEQYRKNLEGDVIHVLTERIWYEAKDLRKYNFSKDETVYRILSDTQPEEWQGRYHEELYHMIQLVLTHTPEQKKIDKEWYICVWPFRVCLHKDIVLKIYPVTLSICDYRRSMRSMNFPRNFSSL